MSFYVLFYYDLQISQVIRPHCILYKIYQDFPRVLMTARIYSSRSSWVYLPIYLSTWFHNLYLSSFCCCCPFSAICFFKLLFSSSKRAI
ncbi:hypothetical protein SGHV141 [Glossina pallidipes salivary gland hypertrophy virus]|uniref:Uncharacterized protein n=1 Tax=Glossina hytrovirus (isolate Glossina pallidipes/Ethiopia/Seibersdorf/-) TaxID=379529 RepID=B0YLU5_GHVS|nr:hypothetical protein SGHV141 [Glossina pallidipes salivary gland hypertrophy virus]ABQ08914.1 hypothetical protein SGHV141 [Glossina pallidipes salivary gland hypertrophy virus]